MTAAVDWLDYHARTRPEHPAIDEVATGRGLTYAGFAEHVARAAGALRRAGVRRGDRVAIVSHNGIEPFAAIYACARLGAIAVPLNWRLSAREIAEIAADFEPAALLFSRDRQDLTDAVGELADLPSFAWGDEPDTWDAAVAAADPVAFDDADAARLGAPWLIIYTSGTTGRPKGVVHTVASVIADLENSGTSGGITPESVALGFLPPFHVAGLNAYPNPVLRAGGRVVVMRAFDAEATLALLQSRRFALTHFSAPSAVLQMLAAAAGDLRRLDLPELVTCVGGSPIPPDLLAAWRGAGWTMVSVYGATEAGSSVVAMPRDRPHVQGSTGVPSLHSRIRIVTLEGADAAPGEIGEIWISGPSLMREYWGRPEATADAVTGGAAGEGGSADDGADSARWYRSGDAGTIDEAGYLHILDRWKDMYISGAENVYPAEVESVLFEHPAVAAAAVIGVPDEKWGEVGLAFLVEAGGQAIDEAELRAWCRERLAGYKVPARIRVVAALPHGGSGKVLKSELRRLAVANV